MRIDVRFTGNDMSTEIVNLIFRWMRCSLFLVLVDRVPFHHKYPWDSPRYHIADKEHLGGEEMSVRGVISTTAREVEYQTKEKRRRINQSLLRVYRAIKY